MLLDAAEISISARRSVQSSYIQPSYMYKDFLMSNFADSKDTVCTNRALMPIAVTETIVKAQGGVR